MWYDGVVIYDVHKCKMNATKSKILATILMSGLCFICARIYSSTAIYLHRNQFDEIGLCIKCLLNLHAYTPVWNNVYIERMNASLAFNYGSD